MNVTEAMNRLYSVALFSPGFHGATATNILLRARDIIAGKESANAQERATLCAELDGLRDNLTQRQELLQRVHDALKSKRIGEPRTVRGRQKPVGG